jgi:sortase B
MRNKTMFSELEKFKEEDFFYKDNKIWIFRDDEEYVYKVFSTYYTDPSYNYILPKFTDSSQYQIYLNNIITKSIYKSDVDVNSNDKIITLSTCSYELKNTRTVVHGKLISTIKKWLSSMYINEYLID